MANRQRCDVLTLVSHQHGIGIFVTSDINVSRYGQLETNLKRRVRGDASHTLADALRVVATIYEVGMDATLARLLKQVVNEAAGEKTPEA